MAKTSVPVNKQTLQEAIHQAEAQGPLPNRSELWKAVENIYNTIKPRQFRPITHSIALLRHKEWNLSCLTPMGKRGGVWTDERKEKMQGRIKDRVRTPRKEKFAKMPDLDRQYQKLTDHWKGETMQLDLVQEIKDGSMGAAVKLMCVSCCDNDKEMISTCNPAHGCPLWAFRPYQNYRKGYVEIGKG